MNERAHISAVPDPVLSEAELLDAVVYAIGEGVVVVDREGGLLLVNPMAEDLLGRLPPNSSVAITGDEKAAIRPEVAEMLDHYIEGTQTHSGRRTFAERVPKVNGISCTL